MEDVDVVYFGTFDADGYPTGFYPSDIWPEPPEGAIQITEVQWRALVRGGFGLVGGQVIELPPRPIGDAT